MKRLILTLAALAGMLCLTHCSSGEKKIQLRYKYVPGEKITYQQNSKRAIEVYIDDTLSTKYSKSVVLVTAVEYEVRSVDENKTATIFERSVWSGIERNLEDSARVDTIEYISERIQRVRMNGKLEHIDFGEDESVTSATYVRSYYDQGSPVFPSMEVSPGYTWTQNTKVILPDETYEASTTYLVKTLVREAGYDCALIRFDGTLILPIEINPEDSTRRHGLDRVTVTGTMYFAYKEGIVISVQEHWKVDGDRQMIKEGKDISYRISVDIDSDFVLKEFSRPR